MGIDFHRHPFEFACIPTPVLRSPNPLKPWRSRMAKDGCRASTLLPLLASRFIGVNFLLLYRCGFACTLFCLTRGIGRTRFNLFFSSFIKSFSTCWHKNFLSVFLPNLSYYPFLVVACAAASLAIGTLNGEHDT